MENNPLMPGRVVIAYDATKDGSERDLKLAVDKIRLRGDFLHGCDTLTLLGVLHRFPHPMGYQMQASPVSFTGPNISAMKDEVSKKVDLYVNLLMQSADSAEECENERVDIEVKITAGTPIKKVVLQEVIACNATWVILDRHLRRDLSFYLKHIPSKVALINANSSLEVCKPYTTDADNVEHVLVFSVSKPVPLLAAQDKEDSEQSVTSCRSNSASSSSLEISETHRSSMSSSFYRSQEQSFSSRSFSSGDSSSMSRQEKSGQ